MKDPARYALAILPVAITGGGWLLATFAFQHFGCTGNIKYMRPCFAGSINLLPFLGFGLFWCQLLLWFAIPWSFWQALKVYASRKGGGGAAA
jgi:hypothetical protein